ncbi:MAG: 2-isopropylmalate synthase, partial [Oscillospiraceae bacterium]|nr:2-isopropylmalate synthase [Oscillospiraceae bacterium]
VSTGSNAQATSAVTLKVDGELKMETAIGDGPIDACFNAIDKIIGGIATLDSYNIQSVTEGVDALGEVIVKLKTETDKVTGRGLSTDIIEASVKAYINGLNKI